MATPYTMQIMIDPTTNQETLSYYQSAHTLTTMANFVLMKCEKLSKKLKKLLRYGINQRQGVTGTESTLTKWATNCRNFLPPLAPIADQNLKKEFLDAMTKRIFAQMHVSQTTAEKLVSIMLKKLAKIAEWCTTQTDIQLESVVSIATQPEKEKVYCLTVPDLGCFKLTIDGPVVSNCDAMGYFVVYRYPIMHNRPQIAQIVGI